jgi:microcystin-dependent protein
MTNLLSLSSKMKLWFDWAFDSSGSATDDFKSMFLLPPGVIMPYYSGGSEEAVKAAVSQLNGGTTASPFWRLCDGSNATPDLRGRSIVGAGQGAGLTQRIFGSVGGVESITIDGSQIPSHGHTIEGRLRFATAKNTDQEDDFGAVSNLDGSSKPYDVAEYSINSSDNNYLYAKPASGAQDSLQMETMSPYYALWYIIRTSRTE